jgi:tetratricopeptide (TPR) repeat protein
VAGFDAWKTVYLYDENYAALDSAIRSVIDTHPDNKRGYIELGRLCERLEDFVCARENFEKALQLDPDDVGAYIDLSRVYEAEGRADKAAEALDLAIARRPGEAYLYFRKADFYRGREQCAEAIEWYRRCLEIAPDYGEPLYYMGVCYAESGSDFERAEECFRTYLGMRLNVWWPQPAMAHCQLAKIYAEQGDDKSAKREIKEAKKLNPGNDEVKRTAKKLRIR